MIRRCCSSCATWAWTAAASAVLDSLSAGIPAGATAIVGPSGAGKSTLLRLLNRLADPDAATISYRGRPLDAYDPLALRREVALVPQLPALLEGTVESNLRYAAEPRRRASSTPARCLAPRRPRPRVRRRATSPSSRSASSSGRCWRRALAQQPARAAARRADLGPRPRRPRRDRGDAGRAAPRARDLDRPRQPRPRAGAPARATGWCGSRPAASIGAARWRRCWREHLDPRRRSGRSPPRWRWSRSRRRSPAGSRPTSSATSAIATVRSIVQLTAGRLRDQADLRGRHDLAGLRPAGGDGPLRRAHRPQPRQEGARTPSGRC